MLESIREERKFLQGIQDDLSESQKKDPVFACYGIWDIRKEETTRGNQQYVRFVEESDVIGGPEEVTQEQILEDLSYVQLKHLVDEKILAVEGDGYVIMKPYAFHDYIMDHTPIRVSYIREVPCLRPDVLFLTKEEGEAYLRDHKEELSDQAKVYPIPLGNSPRLLHLLELLSALDLHSSSLRLRTPDDRSHWATNVDLFNRLTVYIYEQLPNASHQKKWDLVNTLRNYCMNHAEFRDTGNAIGRLYQKDSITRTVETWRRNCYPEFTPFAF